MVAALFDPRAAIGFRRIRVHGLSMTACELPCHVDCQLSSALSHVRLYIGLYMAHGVGVV